MAKYKGIWVVAPTPFFDDGSLDFEGMKCVLDFLIDAKVDGICILANFSEQFLISDSEREALTKLSLEYIAKRTKVIVTISHYATQITVARAKLAKNLGADIVMMMPPYHGALLKGSEQDIIEQFTAVGEVGIPIMLQDAPLSGINLPVSLLVKMAQEIEMLKLFKIECPQAANKLRALIAEGGSVIEGPFDGEEGITLLADLEAGATGSMTSALIPDQIKPVIDYYLDGQRTDAITAYARVLPTINHENRQCGWRGTKVAMVAGGIIKSAFCRHPIQPLSKATEKLLLDLISPLEPLILNWGK